MVLEDGAESESSQIVYNCCREGGKVRLIPDLDKKGKKRLVARQIAKAYREDRGSYCFTVSLSTLEKMVDEPSCKITFPTLNYKDPQPAPVSLAEFRERGIETYSVGRFVTEAATVESIQEILRKYKRKVTGRKEELVERLIELTVEIYRETKTELDTYFSERKFLKIPHSRSHEEEFPLLTGLGLRNLILTMYCLKHLRGNTILEKDYENETYPIRDLARALVTKRLTLEGSFLKVE